MEYALLALFVVGLILSGPIAFIWCFLLQARMRELEEQKERLERMLRQRTESTPSPITPNVQTVISTPQLASPNVQTAMQTAKQHAVEQIKPKLKPKFDTVEGALESITDPAERTAAMWAKAVPLYQELLNREPQIEPPPKHQEVLQPAYLEPTMKDRQDTLSGSIVVAETPDEKWEKSYPAAPPKEGDVPWQSLELWIGRKLLGWVAVIGFIASAAFFIRYAVQAGWVGPGLKVFGIAAFGTLMLGAGKYFWNIGWQRFSTMLSSAGIIIVFQAGYASFAFYQLINITTASVVMTLIVLGGFLLAWYYRSVLLGIVAIIGGFAVPMLLSTGVDRYPEYFTYLIILNTGAVMLVNLLRRAPIGFIAFFGTQIEFWFWHAHFYNESKLVAVLIFHSLFYAVYLFDTTIAAMILRSEAKPKWDDAVRAILSPIIFFGTIWLLLHNNPAFKEGLGIVAFIGAAWYALLAVLYAKHLARIWDAAADAELSGYWKAGPTTATVIALGFVAIGIPLQFDAAWIALGWTTVFAGLWYFGHRQENKTFVIMSLFFAAFGAVRLTHDIFSVESFSKEQLLTPIFNVYALPCLAATSIILTVSVLTNRLFTNISEPGDVIPRIIGVKFHNFCAGIIGYTFLAIILSIESFLYFRLRTDIYFPAGCWEYLSWTVLWSVLALIVLELGVLFRSPALRNVAFFDFSIVAVKVVFCDFFLRNFFHEAIFNPCCPIVIGISLLLIAVAVQSQRSGRFSEQERSAWGSFGLIGIFTLPGILSIECFLFFQGDVVEALNDTIAWGSLSVLWTIYAAVLFALGLSLKNQALRICSIIVFFGTLLKIATIELLQRPAYDFVLINPYFLMILLPTLTAMFFAVLMVRFRSLENESERNAFLFIGLSGLALLWIALSMECFAFFNGSQPPHDEFLAIASLSILWTIMAMLLITLGIKYQSVWLRGFGLFGLGMIAAKIFCFELFQRPVFVVPVMNPYFLTILFPIVAMIYLAVWTNRTKLLKNETERLLYFTFGIVGVVLLWGAASVDCFQTAKLLQNAESETWKAQMSLSILWSIFAGVLICVGFIWRSSILRWIAILLFTVTLAKVLIVDMAGVHELYRFGAVFVLAIFLSLAAWAYQRFKPEK